MAEKASVFKTLDTWTVPDTVKKRFGFDGKRGMMTFDGKDLNQPQWYENRNGEAYASEDDIRNYVGRALGMEGFRKTATDSGIANDAIGYDFSSNQPTINGKSANLGTHGVDYVNLGGTIFANPHKTQGALGPQMSPYSQGYMDKLNQFNDPEKVMATPEYQAAKSAMERQVKGTQAQLGRELASAGVLGAGSTPAATKIGELYYDANQKLNEFMPQVMEQYRRNTTSAMDSNLRAENQQWGQQVDEANQTGYWNDKPTYNREYGDRQQGNWQNTFDRQGTQWDKDFAARREDAVFDRSIKERDLAIRALNASAKKAAADKDPDGMEAYVKEQTGMYRITPKVARLQYTLEHWVDGMADKAGEEDAAYTDLLKQKPDPKDRAAYNAWQQDVQAAKTRTGKATLGLVRSKVDELMNANVIDQLDAEYLFVYMLAKTNQTDLPPELQAKYKVKSPREALYLIRENLPKEKDPKTTDGLGTLKDQG